MEQLLDKSLSKLLLLTEDRRFDLWTAWFNSHPLPQRQQVVADANLGVQAAIDGQGFVLTDTLMSSELDGGALVAPFTQLPNGYGYVVKANPLSRAGAQLCDWLGSDSHSDSLSE